MAAIGRVRESAVAELNVSVAEEFGVLLLHDGEEDNDLDQVPTFLHGLRLLSLDEIEARWTSQVESRERIPLAAEPSEAMADEPRILRTSELGSGNTVPFLGIRSIEDTVQVDLGPAPEGTYGQTFYTYEMETTYLSESVLALVERYARILEGTAYVLEEGGFEPASGSPEVALRVP